MNGRAEEREQKFRRHCLSFLFCPFQTHSANNYPIIRQQQFFEIKILNQHIYE